MLAALGVSCLDRTGREVDPAGETLARIATVDARGLVDLSGVELILAADVTNPLLGAGGASAVFAPQKGASPAQLRQLEAGLDHFAGVLGPRIEDASDERARDGLADNDLPFTTVVGGQHEPGAGAAGGVGF